MCFFKFEWNDRLICPRYYELEKDELGKGKEYDCCSKTQETRNELGVVDVIVVVGDDQNSAVPLNH